MMKSFGQSGVEFMAKVKLGKWEIEEAVLEEQHLAAQALGERQLATEVQARQVSYNPQQDQLAIELQSGVTLLLPTHLLQGVGGAKPEEIGAVQLGPRGASLHWEALNVSFSLAALLAGIFGTQIWMQEMGRRGGRVKSTAKAAAARINGRKGGRPAKINHPM